MQELSKNLYGLTKQGDNKLGDSKLIELLKFLYGHRNLQGFPKNNNFPGLPSNLLGLSKLYGYSLQPGLSSN